MIVKKVPIIRYNRGKLEQLDDPVIFEDWMDLYVNNKLLMGTPVILKEIDELIYGYLFMEGYLQRGERISIRKETAGYFVNLPGEVKIQSIRELVDCAYSKIIFKEDILPLPVNEEYDLEKLLTTVHLFQKLPSVYHETGGVHMAAFSREGKIEIWSDDISRRNAVDKVLGKLFLAETDMTRGFLLTSGRVSSDIIVRLLHAGISLIVSISAPTLKALELADAYGITVCGFARGRRINIYSHKKRIIY